MEDNLKNTITETTQKILVLITPQFNAKRLINEGLNLKSEATDELHILYVRKGNNIFAQGKAGELLQEIFEYAGEKDCVVHAGCGEDVCQEMVNFIMEYDITQIVMGESPLTKILAKKELATDIKKGLAVYGKNVPINVVEKEDADIYKAIWT